MWLHLTNKYLSIQKYKSPVRKCVSVQVLAQLLAKVCISVQVLAQVSKYLRKWACSYASVQVLAQVRRC